MLDLIIREERPKGDQRAIELVHQHAFFRPNTAKIVNQLRDAHILHLSLIAEYSKRVVGHICYTHITIEREEKKQTAIALVSVAVIPDYQRYGVGLNLMHASLAMCRALFYPLIIVQGPYSYFSRFGFVSAIHHNIQYELPIADNQFLILPLQPNIDDYHGIVHYPKQFYR